MLLCLPCFVTSARLSGCEEPGAPPGNDCMGHRSCLSSDPTTADRMPRLINPGSWWAVLLR